MKRIIAFLLSTLMVLSVVSCSDSTSSDAKTNDTSNSAKDAETTEEVTTDGKASVIESMTGLDYNGYNFRIADRGMGDWKTFDVYAEEMTGEPINDAVFERNSLLEEKLNIKIVECAASTDGDSVVAAMAKQSILAQSDDYDVITDGIYALAALVAPGYTRDYREVSSIKPENKWWDPQIYDELSIAGKTYFMTGEISVMDNYGTWCYLFNKKIHSDFGFDNLYDLVNEGKWTIDRMQEMAMTATIDLDGDQKWTAEDQYGFMTEGFNTYGVWACFGEKMATKDSDDLPVYVYNTENAITKLVKSIDIQYSDASNLGTSAAGITRETQFSSGKALFYFAGMRNITLFRDSEVDFGILPAPKYDESQSQYWTTYSYANLTAYSIPVTVTDVEKVGAIMENMAALSAYTLTPAYYDITLIGKSTRDQESEGMVELILNSRNFDLGMIYNWGNVFSTFTGFTNSGSVASTLERSKKAADKALDKFRNEFLT